MKINSTNWEQGLAKPPLSALIATGTRTRDGEALPCDGAEAREGTALPASLPRTARHGRSPLPARTGAPSSHGTGNSRAAVVVATERGTRVLLAGICTRRPTGTGRWRRDARFTSFLTALVCGSTGIPSGRTVSTARAHALFRGLPLRKRGSCQASRGTTCSSIPLGHARHRLSGGKLLHNSSSVL